MSDQEVICKDIPTSLLRIQELLEVLVRTQLGPVLQSQLADPERKQIYEMTGTDLTIKEIGTRLGISVGKISGIWAEWERVGLITKDGKRYRRMV